MVAALSSCCTSLFSVKLRYSHTYRRPITSLRATISSHSQSHSHPKSNSNRQREDGGGAVVTAAGQRKKQSNSKHEIERPTTRGKVAGPQTASSKSFGISRKDKDFVVDSKDHQKLNMRHSSAFWSSLRALSSSFGSWLLLKRKPVPDNNPPQTNKDDVVNVNAPIKDKYDVFVSFRGKDIRPGFLSFLAEAFPRMQINAFVDEKLQRGEEIWSSLVGAIEGSMVSVIIFSENYASSRWCLEELVKILERRDKFDQVVIPVFYNVDPTEVRHQTGSYKTAFRKLARRYGPTMVQIWRDALKRSATLSGINSSDFRNEAELCKKIISDVLDKLTKLGKPTGNPQVLVGIDKLIADIEILLGKKSKNVRIIGIWGMGGIGKTTLAEQVFIKIHSEYDGSCFLSNVREQSSRHGKDYLKETLYSTLLNEDVKTTSPNYLSGGIGRRIGRMKILIVLDDVSDSDHLELFGTVDNFGPGSRIIVTTRDKQLLRAKNVDDIYMVGVLSPGEALELFNLIAFNQSDLEEAYSQTSKRIVDYADGIPLVLKVLGRLLHGKDKEVWESKLDKLKKMPSKEVYDVMSISYDDLDHKEQEIFLDLACFFNGMDMKVDSIKALLKDGESDNSVVDGLQSLNDKALIIISKDNVVYVHDKIQEMAWEIVRRESNGNIGSQSRLGLWDAKNIDEVLENDTGIESIRSLRIFTRLRDDNRKTRLIFNMLARMKKLHFLDIRDYLNDNFPPEEEEHQYVPNKLRYLHWKSYPMKSLSENFSAENLVILNLSFSKVEKLWDGEQNLVNLKQVQLQHCQSLKELPNFSKATNLEELNARVCEKLTYVRPCIFTLDKLEKLDLSSCYSLSSLTSNVQSSRLSYLNLEMCYKLKEFSVTSENMRELNLSWTRVRALPPPFGSQRKLEILNLACSEIESLPSCMVNLTRLRFLDLRYCKKLQTLPELPPSLQTLLMRDCLSLKTVMLPSATTEQFQENKKRVDFWNCVNLDVSSLMAIELNARINVMKFAHQHLSALENGDVKNCDDYLHNYHSYQAVHVFPGSTVPEWLVYKTRRDSVIIDLSSSPPPSPLLGFIFCFTLETKLPKLVDEKLKLEVTISDGSGEDDVGGEDEKHVVEVYVSCDNFSSTKNHVCVIYDQRCSRYLSSRIRSQNLSRFKLKATAWFIEIIEGWRKQMRGRSIEFGVSLTSISEYDRFYEDFCTA